MAIGVVENQGTVLTGNAQPSDVLSGKTFMNADGEKTGSLLTQYLAQAASTRVNGNSLVMKIGTPGYYGDTSELYAADGAWTAENIKSGTSIFGKAGSLTPAPKEASGSGLYLGYTAGSYVDVTGLTFTPSKIYVQAYCDVGDGNYEYVQRIYGDSGTGLNYATGEYYVGNTRYTVNTRMTITNITSSGFRIVNSPGFGYIASYAVTWKAIE